METKKTLNPVPSNEKIAELCDFIDTTFNNNIILINPVAPMVQYSGAIIDKETQETLQKAINDAGLTVARDYKDDNIVLNTGDKVILMANSQPAMTKVITTTEVIDGLNPEIVTAFNNRTGRFANLNDSSRSMYYKKYVILLIHPMNLAARLKKN